MSAIILFNKPYGVLSQFRHDSGNDHASLSDYFSDHRLRVAGRLDATSEGLLLLTADGRVNHAITQPARTRQSGQPQPKQAKTYLVQVEGLATDTQLQPLRHGVLLNDGLTLPAEVVCVSQEQLPIRLWQRQPPIRQREHIPTSWLQLSIYEGKNRQVRRMTAHVGLPCLRLIRWSVGEFTLGSLGVGEFVRVHLNEQRLARLGIQAYTKSKN